MSKYIKSGRPTGYDPEYVVPVAKMGHKGMTKSQICRSLNISRPTFDKWLSDNPELNEAYELSKTYRDAHFDDLMYDVAVGKKRANSPILMEIVRNNHSGYKENKEKSTSDAKTVNNTQINIGNLDDKALQKRIEMVTANIQDVDVLEKIRGVIKPKSGDGKDE